MCVFFSHSLCGIFSRWLLYIFVFWQYREQCYFDDLRQFSVKFLFYNSDYCVLVVIMETSRWVVNNTLATIYCRIKTFYFRREREKKRWNKQLTHLKVVRLKCLKSHFNPNLFQIAFGCSAKHSQIRCCHLGIWHYLWCLGIIFCCVYIRKLPLQLRNISFLITSKSANWDEEKTNLNLLKFCHCLMTVFTINRINWVKASVNLFKANCWWWWGWW